MVGPAAGGFLVADFRTCAFVSCGLQVLVALLALRTFPTPPAKAASAVDPSAAAAVPVEAAAAAAAAFTAAAKPVVAVAAAGDGARAAEPVVIASRAAAATAATPPPGFFAFLSTGVCRTRGALFLLGLRCGLAMAYHVFNTAFQASLRAKFNFTPKLYSTYLVRQKEEQEVAVKVAFT